MRGSRSLVPLVALGAAVVAVVAWRLGARTAPPPMAPSAEPFLRLELEGVGAPVTIVTDRYGIPHVRAETLGDLYFAWGFVTARDRLWQLEHARRAARGALWEWFGNRALEADGGAQLFELASRARRVWERAARDPEVREPLERYARGVNAYLALCREGARPWPEELLILDRRPDDWRPEDAPLLLLAQGLVLDLSLPEMGEAETIRERGADWIPHRRRFESLNAFTTIPDSAARASYRRADQAAPETHPAGARAERAAPGRPPALRLGARLLAEARRAAALGRDVGDEPGRASNVFAVGAARSTSGKPLLANDPHLALAAPGPLHVVHLAVPGEVDAIGAAVPGLPAIVSGRNRACAWGVTSLSADVIDVYADTLSDDGRRVRWNGGWEPIREEPFAMRYRLAGAVPLPLVGRVRRYAPRGPVLAVDRKRRVALTVRWAGDDEDVTLRGLLGLERSRTADEVAARFATLVTPCLNVVAADTAGRVVYQTAGAVPRRGFAPTYGPLPGDGRHEWRGVIPAAEMPAWRVPADGFVVNANNLPVGPDYPEPWPRFDWAHDRAARIAERLGADAPLRLADLERAQNDVYSKGAERMVPLLLRCADSLGGELSGRARAALDTLRAWDYVASRDRVAPTLYRGWYGALQRRSDLGGLTGLTAAALAGRAPEALRHPGRKTPERPAVAAREALERALAELEKKLGPDLSTWRWERAHLARFRHALAWKAKALEPPPVPADGDNSTPCVGRSNLPWSTTFTHGAVFRHLVDLAVGDSSRGLVPPGNSGERASGHARDHLGPWADHGYVPLHLAWDRIEAARETEIRIEPSAAGRARSAPGGAPPADAATVAGHP